MKKTIAYLIMAALVVAFGCNKSEIEDPITPDPVPVGNLKAGLKIIPIIADKDYDNPIGNLIVVEEDEGFTLTASIIGWEFIDNHIYIGLEPPPSPAPGQFPYGGMIIPPSNLNFSISFDELGADCGDFYIAFYAEVSDGTETEGAWAIPEEGAMHWTNPAGKPIGWGAYFDYEVACGASFIVTTADAPLTITHGSVQYQNFKMQGGGSYFGEEVVMTPFLFPLSMADFETEHYIFYPDGVNSIYMEYIYEVGLFNSNIAASSYFSTATICPPMAPINTIQVAVKKTTVTRLLLKNVTINDFPVPGEFAGEPNNGEPLRWNISGGILNGSLGFVLEADIEVEGLAGNTVSDIIVVSFGMQIP